MSVILRKEVVIEEFYEGIVAVEEKDDYKVVNKGMDFLKYMKVANNEDAGCIDEEMDVDEEALTIDIDDLVDGINKSGRVQV